MYARDYGAIAEKFRFDEDEMSSLLDKERENEKKQIQQHSFLDRFTVGVSLFSLAILTAIVVVAVKYPVEIRSILAKHSKSHSRSSYVNEEVTVTSKPFSLFRDGYAVPTYFSQADDAIINYQFLRGFAAIVEPSATMLLEVFDRVSSYEYSFNVCYISSCQSGALLTDGSATGVKFECKPHDVLNISVTAYNEGVHLESYYGLAICMYIRREISSLTPDDLASHVKMMFELYSTESKDGKDSYGDNFEASSYLVNAHHFNTAWQDADHINDGLGFFPQHVKLSNMFETAVQSVDPSFALPYWDFTIEVQAGKTIFDSVMFTENTFGTLAKPTSESMGFSYAHDNILDGKIFDGHWEMLEAETKDQSSMGNSYNVMRGAWNLNPSPYVSRFATTAVSLPTCTDFYSFLRTHNNDLMSWLKDAASPLYDQVNSAIGGTFGCDLLEPLYDSGLISSEEKLMTTCAEWGSVMKHLYRNNYIIPEKQCGVYSYNQTGIDCGFQCTKDAEATILGLESTLKSFLDTDNYTSSQWREWVEFICDGDAYLILPGDLMDTGAPSDPAYWPVHPTLERLYHGKHFYF
jgi:hypothetical protein